MKKPTEFLISWIPWHFFAITMSKVDLEGEELVCVPMSLTIFSSPNNGMEMKVVQVLSFDDPS